MAFRVRVRCSGGHHELLFEDDGTIVIDPALHDLDLERGLGELGAKLPGCVRSYDAYDSNLFHMVHNHAVEFIPGRYGVDEDLTGLILADYLAHVAHVIPKKSNTRRIYDRVLALARKLYRGNLNAALHTHISREAYYDTSLHSAIADAGRSVSRSLAQLHRTNNDWVRTASMQAMSGMEWFAHASVARFSYEPAIQDVARSCRLAAATYAVHDTRVGPQYVEAYGTEEQWQRRHLVAVMTAFIHGGPMPSVPLGED